MDDYLQTYIELIYQEDGILVYVNAPSTTPTQPTHFEGLFMGVFLLLFFSFFFLVSCQDCYSSLKRSSSGMYMKLITKLAGGVLRETPPG